MCISRNRAFTAPIPAQNFISHGSIAQSESENISANVKWSKAQSAKDGKVSFNYKRFLGYRKGEGRKSRN